jgi:hypothetical protein
MKRALAVALLLMSLGSVALADGSGPPPSNTTTNPPKPANIQLADGSGLPPATTKLPQPNVTA